VVMGEHEIAKAMLETVGKMSQSAAESREIDTAVPSPAGVAEKLPAAKGE